jgi:multisubunit Na+/H+ antiporter MnhB subunit
MAWVVGAGAFLGLLAIALGIVTLRTGWIVPTARRHVTRPRLHGLGALLTGSSLVLQGLFYFRVLPSDSWEARFFGGNALFLAGLLLIVLSQLLPLGRSRDHTDPSGV